MTAEQLNALGKSKEQIKSEMIKKSDSATGEFIKKQIQDAYNLGYSAGLSDGLAQFAVSQKDLELFKKQIANGG